MSSQNQPDPRLLLPEWLRDGDAPLPSPAPPSAPAATAVLVEEAAVGAASTVQAPSPLPAAPFSERLSLDTRLDPARLVSADDLPTWLGGLERDRATVTGTSTLAATAPGSANAGTAFEDPEPYAGVDAPEPGVIDVQVNGWYAIAATIALLILLAAALRLYLA